MPCCGCSALHEVFSLAWSESQVKKINFSFDNLINSVAVNVKINGWFWVCPVEKPSFKMLGLPFSYKFHWGCLHYLYFKNYHWENWSPDPFWSFFLLWLSYILISLPSELARDTAAMSGMGLHVAQWEYWRS